MCQSSKKEFFKKFLYEPLPVEVSNCSLYRHFVLTIVVYIVRHFVFEEGSGLFCTYVMLVIFTSILMVLPGNIVFLASDAKGNFGNQCLINVFYFEKYCTL